jgi:hypothetical protein
MECDLEQPFSKKDRESVCVNRREIEQRRRCLTKDVQPTI